MKKNWFQRNPNITMILAYGGGIVSFEKALSESLLEHFPEYEWLGVFAIICMMILLMMWLLMLKGRSFWWLFLVVPVPIAYLFLKNTSESP